MNVQGAWVTNQHLPGDLGVDCAIFQQRNVLLLIDQRGVVVSGLIQNGIVHVKEFNWRGSIIDNGEIIAWDAGHTWTRAAPLNDEMGE